MWKQKLSKKSTMPGVSYSSIVQQKNYVEMRINKAVVFLVFVLISNTMLSQNLCEYDYNRSITIYGDSIKGSSPLSNFPVLVKLHEAELRDVSNGGNVETGAGHDIVFTDNNDVVLNHELDSYNPATGEVLAWVKIPVLTPGQAYNFKVWYGNASQNTSTSSASTWSSDYVGVYHLSESGNGTSGEYSDATSNNFGGRGGAGNSSRVPVKVDTGKIGAAQKFSGDFIEVPFNSAFNLPTSYSISAWVWLEGRTSGTSNIQVILNKQSGGHTNRNFWLVHWDSKWQARISPSTRTVTDPENSEVKTWVYLTLTAGSNELKIYANGELKDTESYSSISTQSSPVVIGNENGTSRYFEGLIDELRVNNTTKSDGRILTEYINQNKPEEFINVGAEQPTAIATVSWIGTNTNWNDAGNWSGSSVPSMNNEVVIPQSATVYPELDAAHSVSNLVVEAGSELIVKPTGTLVSYCEITNNGTITVENNGAIIQRGAADNNTGTGTYIIEREGKISNTAFNVWSSPVPGLAVHDDALVGSYDAVFSDANPCDIFVFDASKQNWSHDFEEDYSTNCDGNPVTFSSNFLISGADGILTTARGYFVPGATPATRTFEGGSIHNGDITKNLQSGTRPGSANWSHNDWNLIGNPYPSAIDVERFLDFNGSELITQAVYVWDDRETGVYDEADYITVNASGSTPGGGNNNITNGNIASCQGFAVQGTGTVTFTNAMREGGNDQFRSGSDFGQNPNTRMWLSVSDNTRQSEMLIALVPGTTREFDKKYDAPKYYGQQNLNIAAQLPGGEDMAIYAESPLTGINEERKIPLTFQTSNTDEMKFAINRSDQMPENLEVFLVDELAGVETNLLKEEHYSFTPDTAGNYRDRFYLKLVNKLTAAEDPTEDYSDITGVEENREEIEVKTWARQNDIVVESRGVQLKSVELIDVSGRTLAIQRATSTNRILMETSGLSSGVYMVRSLDTNGAIRVNKVMLGR